MDEFDNAFQNFWIGDLSFGLSDPYEFSMPRKNNFYMFVFVENASGKIHIDNFEASLGKSNIFILEPSCVSQIDISTKSSGKFLCFSDEFFSLRYNNNLLDRFSFFDSDPKVMVNFSFQNCERMANLLKLIQEEFDQRQINSITILRSYVNIFLFELERLAANNGISKMPDPRLIKIRKFKKLIEMHYSNIKLPSGYANLLNVSTNYLNKLCKEETGQTAGELIRKQIIIEAQRKLQFTNLTINEVAEELGFENVSYFITLFKKQTKVTPEQFRKQ